MPFPECHSSILAVLNFHCIYCKMRFPYNCNKYSLLYQLKRVARFVRGGGAENPLWVSLSGWRANPAQLYLIENCPHLLKEYIFPTATNSLFYSVPGVYLAGAQQARKTASLRNDRSVTRNFQSLELDTVIEERNSEPDIENTISSMELFSQSSQS